MKELREAIASEQLRISGSFSKDYELARARYDEISATMTRLMGEEGASGDTQAKIRELESAAETLRSQYNRAVQQLSEMSKVEAQPSARAGRDRSDACGAADADRSIEEAIADSSWRNDYGPAAGRLLCPAKGLSVRCIQDGTAGDRRDRPVLRRPAGDRER
jgi:hypothetical protein